MTIYQLLLSLIQLVIEIVKEVFKYFGNYQASEWM